VTIIGEGGHAGVIEEILKNDPVPVVKKSYKPGQEITITMNVIIGIGDNETRRDIVESLGDVPYGIALSSGAGIAGDVEIDEGTVVCRGASINNGCRIGKHCIINTNASVDHDCVIGDFVSVNPGATICGGVHIGKGASIGANATVVQGVKVKPWEKVRAGEMVH